MKKHFLPALLSFTLLTGVAPVITQANDSKVIQPSTQPNALSNLKAKDVVATIAGQSITIADLDKFITKYAPNLSNLETGLRRAIALKNMTNARILTSFAARSDYAKSPAYKADLHDLTDEFLVREYLNHRVKSLITLKKLQELYKVHVTDSKDSIIYHAHHILTADEATAQKALKALNSGAKFETVADEYSSEKGLKGGDLGYFSKQSILPELQKALDTLKPGTYTQTPIKSSHGWHIIKLDESRKPTLRN